MSVADLRTRKTKSCLCKFCGITDESQFYVTASKSICKGCSIEKQRERRKASKVDDTRSLLSERSTIFPVPILPTDATLQSGVLLDIMQRFETLNSDEMEEFPIDGRATWRDRVDDAVEAIRTTSVDCKSLQIQVDLVNKRMLKLDEYAITHDAKIDGLAQEFVASGGLEARMKMMEDRMLAQAKEISDLKAQVKEQEKEITRFRSEYEKVKTAFDPLVEEVDELQSKIGDTDQRLTGWIEQVRSALHAWISGLKEANRQINVLSTEVRDIKTQRQLYSFQPPVSMRRQ